MKKILLTFLLILLSSPILVGQTKVTKEEYEVYASVLRDIYQMNRQVYSNKSEFVIVEDTKTDPDIDLTSAKRYKALVKDFKRKNLIAGRIEKNLPSGAYSETYYLITQKEIDELFEKGQIEYNKRYEVEKLDKGNMNPGGSVWGPFYERYPESSGYYTLSRVGFSGLFAMVEVKRSDVHSGFSHAYILMRVRGRWKIVDLISGGDWIT